MYYTYIIKLQKTNLKIRSLVTVWVSYWPKKTLALSPDQWDTCSESMILYKQKWASQIL